MQAHQWQQIRELFDLALDLPATERLTYVESACTDEEVRQAVRDLLRADETASAHLGHDTSSHAVAPVFIKDQSSRDASVSSASEGVVA